MAIHPSNPVRQVSDNGPQPSDLPLQHCHLIIVVIVLDKGLVSYSSKEYASRPPPV